MTMKGSAQIFAAVVAVPLSQHEDRLDFGKKTTQTTWKGMDPDD